MCAERTCRRARTRSPRLQTCKVSFCVYVTDGPGPTHCRLAVGARSVSAPSQPISPQLEVLKNFSYFYAIDVWRQHVATLPLCCEEKRDEAFGLRGLRRCGDRSRPTTVSG